MRISFILPGFVSVPMGGVKVIHEYANRLSKRGHQVTLIYPLRIQTNPYYQLKKMIVGLYDQLSGSHKVLYYTPDPDVSVLVVAAICDKYIPAGDIVIAAGWQTAKPVSQLSATCGKKFYLLQHFETYFRSKKQVLETFHLPMKKVAIAQWIISELIKIGQDAEGPVWNAINFDEFYLETNNPKRTIDIIAVYHHMNVKGPKDLIAILKTLKKRKNISATIIASRKPVHRFPSWVKILIRPTITELRKLYNLSHVFLHTSHSEGWGLPVMEAMACGSAVAAYANEGVKEFLSHEKNALLAPVNDKNTLVNHIQLLLENRELRKTLSKNALNTPKQYSWEKSVDTLETIFRNKVNRK